MADPLSLFDLVQHVRAELLRLREDPVARKDPLMVLSGLDLELEVEVSATAKGGVKFWVVEAGAEAQDKQTHKIKLSFQPFRAAPAPSPTPTGTYLFDMDLHPVGGNVPLKLPIRCPKGGLPEGVIGFSEFPIILDTKKFSEQIKDTLGRTWSIHCTPE